MANNINVIHEMVNKVGWDVEDIDVKRVVDLAEKAGDLMSKGLVKEAGVAFDELGDMFNKKLKEMGRESIDFTDLIKMPDAGTLEKMTSGFATAIAKNISNGIEAGLKDAGGHTKKFMKDAASLQEAYEKRNKNASGARTGKHVRSGFVNKAKGAFEYEPSDTAVKIGANLKAITNEYNKAENWEDQYVALLKYIKAYEALEKISHDPKTLEKWSHIGEYAIDDLKSSRSEIEHSIQNIFNMAYGKALTGLTDVGEIDVDVKLTPIKMIDVYDVVGKKGHIEVPIKIKPPKIKQWQAFRAVDPPHTDDGETGKESALNSFAAEYWADSKKTAISYADNHYGDSSIIESVIKPVNPLIIDAQERFWDDFENMPGLKEVIPGLSEFIKHNPLEYDQQKYINEQAKLLGFDAVIIKNVQDNSDADLDDDAPTDTTIAVLDDSIVSLTGSFAQLGDQVDENGHKMFSLAHSDIPEYYIKPDDLTNDQHLERLYEKQRRSEDFLMNQMPALENSLEEKQKAFLAAKQKYELDPSYTNSQIMERAENDYEYMESFVPSLKKNLESNQKAIADSISYYTSLQDAVPESDVFSKSNTNQLITQAEALEKLAEKINSTGKQPSQFFDDIIADSQLLDEELKDVLQALNMLDDQGELRLTSIHNGFSNLGGAVSDVYTVISRTADYLPKTQDLMSKLTDAESMGANVGTIVDVFEDKVTGRIYELQKTMPGTIIPDNTAFLQATDEQILKLVKDIEALHKAGLYVDFGNDNILYDETNGFSFIDLATRPQEGQENAAGMVRELINSIKPAFENNELFGAFEDNLLNTARNIGVEIPKTASIFDEVEDGIERATVRMRTYDEEIRRAHEHFIKLAKDNMSIYDESYDPVDDPLANKDFLKGFADRDGHVDQDELFSTLSSIYGKVEYMDDAREHIRLTPSEDMEYEIEKAYKRLEEIDNPYEIQDEETLNRLLLERLDIIDRIGAANLKNYNKFKFEEVERVNDYYRDFIDQMKSQSGTSESVDATDNTEIEKLRAENAELNEYIQRQADSHADDLYRYREEWAEANARANEAEAELYKLRQEQEGKRLIDAGSESDAEELIRLRTQLEDEQNMRVATENALSEEISEKWAAERRARIAEEEVARLQSEISQQRGFVAGDGSTLTMVGEEEQLKVLKAAVDDITTSVKEKTQEFLNEQTTVEAVAKAEIQALADVESAINVIQVALGNVNTLIDNIKNDGDIGAGLSNITVNVNHASENKEDQTVSINTESLKQTLGEVLYNVKIANLGEQDVDNSHSGVSADNVSTANQNKQDDIVTLLTRIKVHTHNTVRQIRDNVVPKMVPAGDTGTSTELKGVLEQIQINTAKDNTKKQTENSVKLATESTLGAIKKTLTSINSKIGRGGPQRTETSSNWFIKDRNKLSQTDVNGIIKDYKTLGKLRARFDNDNDVEAKAQLQVLAEEVARKRESLGLTSDEIIELRKKSDIAYQSEKKLLDAAKQKKKVEEELSKQAQQTAKETKEALKADKKSKADQKRLAKRQAMTGKAGNAIGRAESTWLEAETLDQKLLPDGFKRQVEEYYDALDELRVKHNDINAAATAEEVEKLGNELIEQTKNVNKMTEEIGGLISEYQKLSGANVDEEKSKATGLTAKSSLDEYQQQMKQYVQEVTSGQGQIKKFDANTKTLTYTVKTGAHEFTEYTVAVRNLDHQLVSVRGATKKTETFIEATTRKMKELTSYITGMGLISRVGQELRRGIQYVREIDLALTELKKVTDETEETYDKFLDTAAKTGARLGTTISAVTEATATFAKLGYSMEQATEMAEAAIVYKNVGDNIASTEDAADSIISTMKGFGLEASESMAIVDKFNEVGNRFAITSKGIGEALRLSASALSEGSNSLDESIALITAANEVVNDPSSVGKKLADNKVAQNEETPEKENLVGKNM